MSAARIAAGLALALAALATGSTSTAADAYRVRAFVDPLAGVDELTLIRLVIEAEGTGNVPLTQPTIGALTNLRIVSGPQSSFESVWSNGRFTAKSRLIYSLQAERPGPAIVPAIDVVLGSETHRTQPIRLEVAPARRGGAPAPAPRSAPPRGGEAREADVFIRAEIGTTRAVVGQAVTLSVALFAAEQVLGYDWVDQPALSSYWVEDLAVDPNGESYRATIEGRRYTVFPMKRQVLVPQAAGEFEIEPWTMQIQIRQRSSDPFDLFSFGRGTAVLRKTQPLALAVRPLPAEGRPADFGGAVGRYEFEVAFDRQSAAVNEAVALKATVQGEGFLGTIDPPRFDFPADLQVFPPKVSSSARGVRGQIVSRKTWEWVLVPLAPGEMRMPDPTFSYFDPASGRYESASRALGPLVVERSTKPDGAIAGGGEIRLQRRDLAFIKPLRGPLRTEPDRAHERAWFLALLGAPLVWVPLVVAAGRHRSRLQRNLGLARSRRARSRAAKRLRGAGRMLDGTQSAAFHEEVARALVEYIADRFDRAAAGLTYEAADGLLAAKGLDPGLRGRFRRCLESCDFARFVPAAAHSERRAEVLAEARSLLDALEAAL